MFVDDLAPLAIALFLLTYMGWRLYGLGDTMTCDAEDGVIDRLTARPGK